MIRLLLTTMHPLMDRGFRLPFRLCRLPIHPGPGQAAFPDRQGVVQDGLGTGLVGPWALRGLQTGRVRDFALSFSSGPGRPSQGEVRKLPLIAPWTRQGHGNPGAPDTDGDAGHDPGQREARSEPPAPYCLPGRHDRLMAQFVVIVQIPRL